MFRRRVALAIVPALVSTACFETLEAPETPRADEARLEPVEVVEETAPEEEEQTELVLPAAFNGKYDPILEDEKPVSNAEDYTNYGVNPFVDPRKDPLSTFSIDVDTGAYTVARRKLNEGTLPPKDAVRVEEFVNCFRYDYPDPANGPFAVHLEGAPSPFVANQESHLVRVGIQGKRIDSSSRKPVHLVFLVDVSGSMNRPDKLGLAKESLKILTNNLGPKDTVALATYAGRVAEILPPTGMEHRGRILEALDDLRAGGSTAMNSGLEIAYRLALENYESTHVNRVIVLSDGDANVGPSSHRQILERIEHFVDQGVTLSTIGFGMGNYKDTMMEQLANNGNGNYYYIDSEDEARKVFGDQLDGTLQVIAKDVKIQVEFNPEAVREYRLIGYENRDIADEDFRDDTVDAGEIGAGHTVTAMYEVKLKENRPSKIGDVRIRHIPPQGDTATETVYRLGAHDFAEKVSDASADFQFATAVTAFAELLRKSPYAGHLSYDLVHEIATGATRKGQADRREFIQLVERARGIAEK
jgi:Ca-activated chloride channel family protein